jgi:5-carboxymethyl-2-hydroxymuconate isomerase
MPHCVVEYSSSLEANELNKKVFLGAMDSNLFAHDGSDIKVRAFAYDFYQTGDKKEDFIHVSLRILSGRSDEDKSKLSSCVMEQLKTLGLIKISITIEVIDMDRNSYSKLVV